MPNGGVRPGAGAKKGSKHAVTLTKEQARDEIRKAIGRHADQLVEAQIANARGINYLVRRDKRSGKFLRVSADQLDKQTDDDIIEMWTKDPSVQAFTDLLNRYLDKPKEQEQEHQVTGKLVIEISKGW